MSDLLSIVTPTYNRVDTLKVLFDSLVRQTSYQFEWIVIDDGSTDETKVFFENIICKDFTIKYVAQKNGGKHRALNSSHSYVNGSIVLILDSDDYLVEDAVETVIKEWQDYKMIYDICGMSYLKGKPDGSYLSKKNEADVYIDDDIHYRVNNNIRGDRCEVLRADLFKKYSFPEFEGEKFMSEGWLWTNLAKKFKTVYRNKIIYICDYLPDGLTKGGRKLRLLSPLGMIENCKAYLCKEVRLAIRIKETLLYAVYARGTNVKFNTYRRDTNIIFPLNVILYPFGKIIYTVWSKN